jgi:hypothetical protein
MAPAEPETSKLGAAAITTDMTLTIPGTRKIFEPGSATRRRVIMAAQNTGLLTIYGIKKQKEKIPSRNLGQ